MPDQPQDDKFPSDCRLQTEDWIVASLKKFPLCHESRGIARHIDAQRERIAELEQQIKSRDENMAALLAHMNGQGFIDDIRRDTNERWVAERLRDYSACLRRCSVAAAAISEAGSESEAVQTAGKVAFACDLTSVDHAVSDRICDLECREAQAVARTEELERRLAAAELARESAKVMQQREVMELRTELARGQ